MNIITQITEPFGILIHALAELAEYTGSGIVFACLAYVGYRMRLFSWLFPLCFISAAFWLANAVAGGLQIQDGIAQEQTEARIMFATYGLAPLLGWMLSPYVRARIMLVAMTLVGMVPLIIFEIWTWTTTTYESASRIGIGWMLTGQGCVGDNSAASPCYSLRSLDWYAMWLHIIFVLAMAYCWVVVWRRERHIGNVVSNRESVHDFHNVA